MHSDTDTSTGTGTAKGGVGKRVIRVLQRDSDGPKHAVQDEQLPPKPAETAAYAQAESVPKLIAKLPTEGHPSLFRTLEHYAPPWHSRSIGANAPDRPGHEKKIIRRSASVPSRQQSRFLQQFIIKLADTSSELQIRHSELVKLYHEIRHNHT